MYLHCVLDTTQSGKVNFKVSVSMLRQHLTALFFRASDRLVS